MPLRGREARRRPGHSRSASWGLAAVLLAVVALLAGGLWLYQKGMQSRVAVDAESLCPAASRVSSLTVVLIDASDAITPAQNLDISNRLARLLDEVPRHGLIQVYNARALRDAVSSPDAQLCNPGDEASVNEIYENPRMAREKWNAFSARLRDQLARQLVAPPAASSPIFETIQAVGLRSFDNPANDGVKQRKLIVISDLMQNVPGKLSMYEGVPSFTEFSKDNYYTSVRTQLDAVEVVVLYIARIPQQPWPEHPVFWEQYFADQGAHVSVVVPIHGAP